MLCNVKTDHVQRPNLWSLLRLLIFDAMKCDFLVHGLSDLLSKLYKYE